MAKRTKQQYVEGVLPDGRRDTFVSEEVARQYGATLDQDVPRTASNGFGTNISQPGSEYDNLIEQRYKETQSPINRDQIRKQKVAQFQAEIDATNQIYTNLLAKAEVEGADRSGQQRALNARSGNLTSGRGIAQAEQVNTYNRGIEGDIGARKTAALSQIMNSARAAADQEIQEREAARSAGRDQYLDYLGSVEERKASTASTVLQSLLQQGLSLEDITPEDFTELAASLRMTPTQLANVYKGELASAQAASEAAQYERQLKEREFGLKEGEFGLKAGQFEFDQQKFNAELDFKYQELNRLLNNDQLDAEVKNVEIQKKMAEIQELNTKNGIGGFTPKDEANLRNTSDALAAVTDLLNDPNRGRATGASSLLNFLPGSKGADFSAKLDRVKSLITLPELEKLKGLGAMSDREFKTLSDAAAALNPNMSEQAFQKELERVHQALSATKTRLEANSLINPFESGGSEGANPKAPVSSRGSLPLGDTKVLARAVLPKFHEGAKGGQCITFLHRIAEFPSIGDRKSEKFASVDKFGIPKTQVPAQAKVGMILITDENKDYGHGALINAISEDGRFARVTESNYKSSERVSHDRVIALNSPRIYGAIQPKSLKTPA